MAKIEMEIKNFANSIGAIDISPEAKKIFNRENYFKFPDTQTLIIIKISRSDKPFFGVDKKVIEIANQKCDKFYLTLLTSEKSGWVYSKNEINSNIKNGFWKYRPADENYKINYGDLSEPNLFLSPHQFLEKIHQRGGKGDIENKISKIKLK